MAKIPRKIVQISAFGVENSCTTQAYWMAVALASDGTAWVVRDNPNDGWWQLPALPDADGEEPSYSIDEDMGKLLDVANRAQKEQK